MDSYILGIRKQIREFSDFENLLNLFQSIQEMLDNPLSFWNLKTLLQLTEYSKEIEGDKTFYKFLKHYNTLDKITKHPLAFYLLGDSESYFFAGEPQEGKPYFSSFATKFKRREVAGLLPSNSEGEGKSEFITPYLYDIIDINEGKKLMPIPSNEIINILGKNYFLDFLTKLQNLLKFFSKAQVNDSLLFRGMIKKILIKIDESLIEDITEKLFPIPVRTSNIGFSETKLVYADDLVLNYSPDFNPIPYGELTKGIDNKRHHLELFNFRFDYKDMILFELSRIIYETGDMGEVSSFIQNEITSLAQNNVSLVLTNNFIASYVDKINKINMETDLIEFCVGNPQQAAYCYGYNNYMTNISKFVTLNLQKIDLSKMKNNKGDYNKPHIELVQEIVRSVFDKIEFNMLGDNLERDLFATSDLARRVDYLQYNFSSVSKRGINLNRYFSFPPFIELGINVGQDIATLQKEEVHTISEEEKIVNYRRASIQRFKKARELTFPAEKSIIYYSLEYINTFGITRLDINRCITLKFLESNLSLKKALKRFLKEVVDKEVYQNNFIGEFIAKFSSYVYKKGTKQEIAGVSITNTMLSFLILPKLYKAGGSAENFIKIMTKEIKKGIREYERINPSNEELLSRPKYDYLLCFIHRLLLSSKIIWDTLKIFKNLIYVKTNEGYETLFNYINKKSIKRWGTLAYSSIEELIKKRDYLFTSGVDDFAQKEVANNEIRNEILNNLGHLLVEIDYINFLREVKEEDLDIIIDIPGNMLNKIYDSDKIADLTIRNVFDFVYFDYSNAALESVSGIDMFVGFIYYKLGLEKTSLLIYNDYKLNKNINFIYRLFDRLLFRNQSEMTKKIINQIGTYDNDLFMTLSNKYKGAVK